jgi:hypothetical protein
MAYYETTYNTANPALDIMTNLQTWMPANGYVFVETYTSGTNISDVYKSPGTSNSFGTDFYIGFNRISTTTTTVSVMVFEQYNVSTHLATKYAPQTGGTSMTPASDGSVNDSGVLLSSTTSGASLYKSTYIYAPVSTAITHYVNINVNRIIWGNSTSYSDNGYAGLYDPIGSASLFPLIVLNIGYNSYNGTITPTYTNSRSGALTRETYVTAATTNWAVYNSYTSSSAVFQLSNDGVPSGTNPKTGFVYSSLFTFTSLHAPAYQRQLGTLKDFIYNPQGAANTAGGDTLSITVGANTYNYVKPSTYVTYPSYMWIPKQ